MLSIVFVSNFINHHQVTLCEALYKLTDENFHFIATEPVTEERKKLGYKTENNAQYLKFFDDTEECGCEKLIDEADIVIFGSAPASLCKNRIRNGKIVFKYSERPLKKGLEIKKYIPRLIKWNITNPRRKPVYLLAASAFAAEDYKKFGLFPKKKYKWGYFPAAISYENPDSIMAEKNTKEILWAGRFLDWKRPCDAVEVARILKADGYDFKLKIIGCGAEENNLKNLVSFYGLEGNIEFLGSMPPEEVRRNMEKSGIFLFTSTKYEGWGAVLNEAMNSGCAVVANEKIGSVPYLINAENGFEYKDGDIADCCEKVKALLDDPQKQKMAGLQAYKTITELWNAEVAAERFVKLCKEVMSGEKYPDLFESGPCSRC